MTPKKRKRRGSQSGSSEERQAAVGVEVPEATEDADEPKSPPVAPSASRAPQPTRDIMVPAESSVIERAPNDPHEDPQVILAKLRGDLVRLIEHLKNAEVRARELKGGDPQLLDHLKKASERVLKAKTRSGVLAADLSSKAGKSLKESTSSLPASTADLENVREQLRVAKAEKEKLLTEQSGRDKELSLAVERAAEEARASVCRIADQEITQLKEKTKELLRKAAEEIRRLKGASEPIRPSAIEVQAKPSSLGPGESNDPDDTQKLNSLTPADLKKKGEVGTSVPRSGRYAEATRAIEIPKSLEGEFKDGLKSPPSASPVIKGASKKPDRSPSVKSTQILSVGNLGIWQEEGSVREVKPPRKGGETGQLERPAIRPEDLESKDPDKDSDDSEILKDDE